MDMDDGGGEEREEWEGYNSLALKPQFHHHPHHLDYQLKAQFLTIHVPK